jgi:hypothetical protein
MSVLSPGEHQELSHSLIIPRLSCLSASRAPQPFGYEGSLTVLMDRMSVTVVEAIENSID